MPKYKAHIKCNDNTSYMLTVEAKTIQEAGKQAEEKASTEGVVISIYETQEEVA